MPEVQLTEAGRKELEARLDYLKSVRRAEIAEIEAKLRMAKIIHETTVTCAEIINGKQQEKKTYTIVGTAEADLKVGRISDESPVGSALIRAQEGQVVQVTLPNGKIKSIKVIKVSK